jgi:hypothetical protein
MSKTEIRHQGRGQAPIPLREQLSEAGQEADRLGHAGAVYFGTSAFDSKQKPTVQELVTQTVRSSGRAGSIQNGSGMIQNLLVGEADLDDAPAEKACFLLFELVEETSR